MKIIVEIVSPRFQDMDRVTNVFLHDLMAFLRTQQEFVLDAKASTHSEDELQWEYDEGCIPPTHYRYLFPWSRSGELERERIMSMTKEELLNTKANIRLLKHLEGKERPAILPKDWTSYYGEEE